MMPSFRKTKGARSIWETSTEDMLEALAFYKEVLKVQPEPCMVLPYSNGKTKYIPSGKGFQIRDSETIYKGYNEDMRSPLLCFMNIPTISCIACMAVNSPRRLPAQRPKKKIMAGT